MSTSLKAFSAWFKNRVGMRLDRRSAKLAWQEAWQEARNQTILEILKECEGRSGKRCTRFGFEVVGGGLYAMEQIAPENGAFPKIFYERQRIELEHMIIKLFDMLPEALK